MSDYTSWQDLLDEEDDESGASQGGGLGDLGGGGLSDGDAASLGADALSSSSIAEAKGGDPLSKAKAAMGEGMEGALEKITQGDVSGGLSELTSSVPGLSELMAKQAVLRDQMEALTGNKGSSEDPRFPFLQGPRQPLGGGDPKQRSAQAAGGAAHDGTAGQNMAFGGQVSREDHQRDMARDARRWGVEPDFFAGQIDGDEAYNRDQLRDQQRHLLAFERTEQRMARSGRAAGVSRAAAMRQAFQDHTDRMQKNRDALRDRRRRLEAGNPRQQARAERLGAREQRMDQRIQRRRGVSAAGERRHEAMRARQAAMRRSHERFKNKQMRIRQGAAWLPKPGLRSASTSPPKDIAGFVQRLPLKQLAGLLRKRGDQRMDIGWPFQRDADAERRRQLAQQRRRQERADKRRQERDAEKKKDEGRREKERKKREGRRKK